MFTIDELLETFQWKKTLRSSRVMFQPSLSSGPSFFPHLHTAQFSSIPLPDPQMGHFKELETKLFTPLAPKSGDLMFMEDFTH